MCKYHLCRRLHFGSCECSDDFISNGWNRPMPIVLQNLPIMLLGTSPKNHILFIKFIVCKWTMVMQTMYYFCYIFVVLFSQWDHNSPPRHQIKFLAKFSSYTVHSSMVATIEPSDYRLEPEIKMFLFYLQLFPHYSPYRKTPIIPKIIGSNAILWYK